MDFCTRSVAVREVWSQRKFLKEPFSFYIKFCNFWHVFRRVWSARYPQEPGDGSLPAYNIFAGFSAGVGMHIRAKQSQKHINAIHTCPWNSRICFQQIAFVLVGYWREDWQHCPILTPTEAAWIKMRWKSFRMTIRYPLYFGFYSQNRW